MTDWPIGGPHISNEHNRRDQKGLIIIKHPVTKNSAKEEYKLLLKKLGVTTKKSYFPHFQEHLFYKSVLLSLTKIFDVIVLFQCFTVTLTKCNSNNVMLPCPASTLSFI